MDCVEYQNAKAALERSQRVIEDLVSQRASGAGFDEAMNDLRAAKTALEKLIESATTSQREMATMDNNGQSATEES